ncbi:MAG: T9SS type A sorting domain-containing protein [Bacteroidia bacterium]|nr:T9SS type A sorting domain-containing protein [Bacteroidia bacterium]
MRKYLIFLLSTVLTIPVFGLINLKADKNTDEGAIIKYEHQKDLQNINSVLWTNDFSVASNWVITNTTGDNQNWIITTSAPVGTYSSALGIIGSTTAANGFALFDSDHLGTTGGTQNASITNSAPINLTNKINTSVTFQQKYRRYQVDRTYIGISTNGTIWTDFEVNASLGSGQITTSPVTVDISSVADNHSLVWLRFHYIGVWDYAWMVDDVQISGIDNPNAPQIVSVNPNTGHQGQTLSVTISGQNTHFSQGNETIWFNQGSSTIFYGSGITVNSQTSSTAQFSLPYNAPTGNYDVHVQNPVDGLISYLNGFQITSWAPSWTYTSTGISHSIVIPNYANITIDGVAIQPGDYIGVFYDQSGAPTCGGYVEWTGTTVSVIAYGASGGDNGFNTGETFVWKIWKASSNLVYNATPSYFSTGFPNMGTFVVSGLSGLSGLAAVTIDVQNINIVQGWSIMSTYINPTNANVVNVFSPLTSLVILKNGSGQVYWPAYSINQIGNMVVGQGYQVNVSSAGLLTIQGTAVIPQSTPINIPATWSIIGYLRQTPGPVVNMMSPIVNNIMMVKDGNGQVYWPLYGVNGIGNMQPGQGYQIRMTATATFYYPANSNMSLKSSSSSQSPVHFYKPTNTGNNMVIGIPSSCLPSDIRPGDELGVFTTDGLLVGSTVYYEGNIAITAWGNDDLSPMKDGLLPGEDFRIKYWSNENKIVQDVIIENWMEGNGKYEINGVNIARSIKLSPSFSVCPAFPDPANDYTDISFEISANSRIVLSIMNISGELMYHTSVLSYESGMHTYRLQTSAYPAGLYFCIIKNGYDTVVRKFMVIR